MMMGNYSEYANEPPEVWRNPIIARKWCLMLAAGKAAQFRFAVGPRLQNARHEAAHLVAGWVLGFKCTGAVLADDPARGGVAAVGTQPHTDRLPKPVDVHRERSRIKTNDTWRIARLVYVHGWASGWKAIRAAVRQIRQQAMQLVRENWDAIRSVAHDLNERGQLGAVEFRLALYAALAYQASWRFTGLFSA